jgi:hypothetical protein
LTKRMYITDFSIYGFLLALCVIAIQHYPVSVHLNDARSNSVVTTFTVTPTHDYTVNELQSANGELQ